MLHKIIICVSSIFFVTAILPLCAAEDQSALDTENIYIGLYLVDISAFDLTEGRFNADFYLWCKWLGDNTIPPLIFSNGEIDLIEIVNREDEGSWHTVRWHVQGTFRGTFPLHKFPFDTQTLTIETGLESGYGTLQPDLAGSGMSERFSITGWLYAPFFKTKTRELTYASDFGSIAEEGKPLETKSLNFSVLLKRPMAPYIIKFLLPLIFIILVSMAVFFISPDQLEVNMGVGVTTLLTCVAFQFSLADSIPDVPYLVTADKFFIIAYLIVFINIIETIVTFNIDKRDTTLSQKIDRYSWKILGGLLVVCISVIFFVDVLLPEKRPAEPLPAVSGEEHPTSKPELVVSMPSIKTLNTGNIKQGLLYRGLFHEIKGGKKVPHLAVVVPSFTNEYVRFLPDGGVVITWKLKENLHWGDGSPITAEDLLFSTRVSEDPDIRDIRKIDGRTIEVEYNKRVSSVLSGFTLYPRHHYKEIYEKEGLDGIYTKVKMDPPPMDGPYILESFVPGEKAVFIVNPYFAGKTPALSRITLLQITSPLPEIVKAGETGLCGNLSVSSYNQVLGVKGFSTREDPLNNLYLLQPDINIFPYNHPDFRKALMHGINRNKIRELLFSDRGEIAHSYRPRNALDYNPDIKKYDYDPDRARKLLKPLGISMPLHIIVSMALSTSPEFVVVQAIRGDLEKIGLTADIEIHESSISPLFSSGKHGGMVYISRSSLFDQPAKFWNIPYLETERTPTDIFTPEVISLEGYFTRTMFIERKYSLSRQLQLLWSKDIPIIPLAFGVYRSVFHENLRGWDPKAVESNIWWNVEYWYFE